MENLIDQAEDGDNIVYIREVSVTDLPKKLRDQAEGLETLFSVHRSDGAPVALVANHRLAVELARENDLQPMRVH